jgi:hypothetical protein
MESKTSKEAIIFKIFKDWKKQLNKFKDELHQIIDFDFQFETQTNDSLHESVQLQAIKKPTKLVAVCNNLHPIK